MKDSKFWIWFIPIFAIVCVGLYYSISISDNMNNSVVTQKDTKVINEYKEVGVTLSENINYIYVEQDKLSDLITNEDGILFIGNTNDNNSKNSIKILNDVVLSTDIENIYYLNNENITIDTLNILKQKKLDNGMVITFSKENVVSTIKYEDISEDKLKEKYSDNIKLFIETCDESC